MVARPCVASHAAAVLGDTLERTGLGGWKTGSKGKEDRFQTEGQGRKRHSRDGCEENATDDTEGNGGIERQKTNSGGSNFF